MDTVDAIDSRRSIKTFTSRTIPRSEIERLLDTVTQAPNHRMTQPWRFYVLGPRARRAYGEALGARKAKRVDDPEAAAAVKTKVADEHEALPAMIGIAVVLADDPEVREEDFAAVFMGIQNFALAATAIGLGTHIKTGAVMEDPAARKAAGVRDDERLIAIVNLGEPAEVPAPKPRVDAVDRTTWMP